MERTISTKDLGDPIKKLVESVQNQGDTYLIEQGGRAEAALVPMPIYAAFKENRQKLISLMERLADRNKHRPADDIEADIAKAIAEVRSTKQGPNT